MRIVLVIVAAALLLIEPGGGMAKRGKTAAIVSRANVSTSPVAKTRVDFDTQLKPIFKSKCMPCHFSGGQMYDSLPFDKPQTIRKLGTKLFTRIKEEDSRRLIEEFLTQSP